MSEEQGFAPPVAGAEHELMKPFEGTFKAKVKMWFGPGEPMESTGTMVNTFELNGLFLQQDYKGDAVDGPFPNFAGKGYWGFNTVSKQFEGFWIDTATTQMQMEFGSVDESGKTWEMQSEFTMGGPTMKKRAVFTVVDDNHHSMVTYVCPPEGEEFKNMEIHYERV